VKWNKSALAAIGIFSLSWAAAQSSMGSPEVVSAIAARDAATPVAAAADAPAPQPDVQTPAPPAEPVTGSPFFSDPANAGRAYPPGTVAGLLTFRGNPTRTYYGSGPISRQTPQRLWRYPEQGGLCGTSDDGSGATTWCGTGWTGQPAVFEREGRTWAVFGAYDYGVHFLDADTGEQLLPPFPTGDIIKGSVTVDPDGYPLVYTGSRDNYLRVLAIDGDEPREVWKLSADAVSPVKWNNDWDGSPLVVDDYLFEGGENSQFHIVKLNRGYDERGRVTVDPELVFNTPGWDEELLADFGSDQVSIENSVSMFKDTVYFANSGGLVQGWDVSGLREGRKPKQVFRFWTGDDTDASIVIDEQGFLYVGSEYEKGNARSREIGQMMKLDPTKPDDPLVWSVKDQKGSPAGVWGTPALHRDVVIFDTNGGDVLALDRDTGDQRWRFSLPGPTWQSPVVMDDVLLMGDCQGTMHAYDVADTTVEPQQLWRVKVGGCIESTPAVWRGRIYFGTRDGGIHAFTAAGEQAPDPAAGLPANGGANGETATAGAGTTETDGAQ
jgi:outer membrane protein assembly factor BamB